MTSYLQEIWELTKAAEVQGIWFWAALYALIVCGYSVIYQLRVRSWPSAEGTLDEACLGKFGAPEHSISDQEYQLEVTYSYEVSGTQYHGTRVSPWLIIASHNQRGILKTQLRGIKYHAPNRVDVIYNPSKPSKSFLVRPGRLGLFVTLLIAVVPFLAYFIKFHA